MERHTGAPLVLAFLRLLSDSAATQCALAYTLFQVVLVVSSQLTAKWLIALAGRLAPLSPEEALMKPRYIFQDAVNDPSTALALVALEQDRLISFLPDFLEDLRPLEERSPHAQPLKLRAAGSEAIAQEIDEFIGSTLRANPDMSDVEGVFAQRSRLHTLQPLQTALTQFASGLLAVPAAERPPFAAHMVEGLHAILTVAAETVTDPSGDTQHMLYLLTEERSALMERVRQELLTSDTAKIQGREALLSATLTFERVIWLLRRLSPPPVENPQGKGETADTAG